jgi:hypothetical protein
MGQCQLPQLPCLTLASGNDLLAGCVGHCLTRLGRVQERRLRGRRKPLKLHGQQFFAFNREYHDLNGGLDQQPPAPEHKSVRGVQHVGAANCIPFQGIDNAAETPWLRRPPQVDITSIRMPFLALRYWRQRARGRFGTGRGLKRDGAHRRPEIPAAQPDAMLQIRHALSSI